MPRTTIRIIYSEPQTIELNDFNSKNHYNDYRQNIKYTVPGQVEPTKINVNYGNPILQNPKDNAINTRNQQKLNIKYGDTGAPNDITPVNIVKAELDYGQSVYNFGHQDGKLAQGKRIEFLLKQELLYVMNPAGYGNLVNPLAIMGKLPFLQGDVHTTLDYDLARIPGIALKNIRNIPSRTKYITSENGIKIKMNTPGIVESDDLTNSPIGYEATTRQQLLTSPGAMLINVATDFIKGQLNDMKSKALNNIKKDAAKEVTSNIKQFSIISNDYSKQYETLLKTTGDDSSAKIEFNAKGLLSAAELETLKQSEKPFNFYLTSLNYDESSAQKHVFFKAIINNISEIYSPSWNQDDVFGRVHPIWVYSNVNRTINVDFVIVALEKNIKSISTPNVSPNSQNPTSDSTGFQLTQVNELDYLRQKAGWLARHTYPSFTKASENFINFKSGPFISLTVGNLFKDLNGFISSLEFDWNYTKRWDMKDQFPQGVRVTMRVNVIEKQLVQNSDEKSTKDILTEIYEPFEK